MEANKVTLLTNPIEAENKEPWMWYCLTELMKTRNLASRGHTGAHPTEGHLDPPTTPEEMAKYHRFQGAESEEQSQVSWPR